VRSDPAGLTLTQSQSNWLPRYALFGASWVFD
jgi:hypothetical protein